MRSMVEGLALTPEQPLHHRLTAAVPLPVRGRIGNYASSSMSQ
jgi:hypothetical protein